ncbi:hypothetical protein EHQ91_08040 [Leptospira biflexa]|uniref:hypothetical protein n=1 Tax=Leptospira biflexa TaxID=172 RepID=UPI0011005C65|nr:hypothetical protein [Leptospira biflexa]TGM54894.1 hypothetical protein EHQ91_08040 [Leptospira biflexa]
MEVEKGCEKGKLNQDIVEGCIQKQEDLQCFQYLNSLGMSKLDKIFYSEAWESNDTQSFIYILDKAGNVKVMRGGPDKNKDEFELSGHGKLQRRNGKWHYHHSCELDFCEKFDFDIEYLDCYAGYASSYNAYVLIVTMQNSDWFEDDEDKRKLYKELAFVKLINQKPQITNGFTSTKVPPIPSQ